MANHAVKEHPDTWEISASSGRGRLECWKAADGQDEGTVVCAVRIIGLWWQRDRPLEGGAMVPDLEVLLPQVVLDASALETLRQRLIEWHVNPSDFQCRLSAVTNRFQLLSVSIGQDPEFMYSIEKPTCSIEYKCGPTMSAKWSFIVDQSCIRLCSDSLGAFLASSKS